MIVDHAWPLSVTLWLALAGGCLVTWCLLWLGRWDHTAAAVLLLAIACLGGARRHERWRLFPADEFGRAATIAPRPICVRARALTSPRRVVAPPGSPLRTRPLGERSRLLVQVAQARHDRAWIDVSGVAELFVEGHVLGVRAGDELQIFATVQRLAGPLNPGEFDLAWYRRGERQLVQLQASFPDSVSIVKPGTLWDWRRMLAAVRDPCQRLLWAHVDVRAGLASALLLGAREYVDWEQTEPFVTTGTVHLLAISGVHLGILAIGFWWITRLFALGRRATLLSVIGFVVLYALLTDARPPVVRASVLLTTFCLARLSARRTSGFNALAAAAGLLIAWNPAVLFQVGAQLSFLAVVAIYLAGPALRLDAVPDPLDQLIAQTRPWYVRGGKELAGWLWGMLWISGAIWFVTMPLIAKQYHLVSPVALVLNPLVWLPVGAAMFSGFAVLLFGWLIPPIGAACGWVCTQSLGALEWLVGIAHRHDIGYYWTPAPAQWWVYAFYGGLAVWAGGLRPRVARRWAAVALALWLAIGALTTVRWPAEWRTQPRPLVCTFLAVGHGACAIVELPRGRTMLCDAGSMGAPEATAQIIAEALWSRRITHLDAVVLSHADADHFNALPGLLERFSVGVVYVSPMMFDASQPALAALSDSIRRHGIDIVPIWRGCRLKTPDASDWRVLHPPRHSPPRSDNANSLTLRGDYGGRTLLFPGDLERPGLDEVLSQAPLACDVALVPHHGSARSLPEAYLAWCRPRWIVISAAANEGFAAARAATAAGARAFNTGRSGAVQVTIDPLRIDVRTWRDAPW